VSTTDNPTREALDRRRAIWERQPTLHYDEVIAQADAELAAEAERHGEGQRKAAESSDSFGRITGCPCCGEPGGALFSSTGYCPRCEPVIARLEADALAGELVGGRSRHDLAVALLERRRGAG
jgi:hypothetical protein